MTRSERVVGQLTSGRWILTVLVGVCLVVFSLAYVSGEPSLSPELFGSIFTAVIMSYFKKERPTSENNGNGNEGSSSLP